MNTPDPSPRGGETDGESWADITRIAWPVAARALGWSPDSFWAATPTELLGALRNPAADPAAKGAPLDRAELARLMEAENGR